MNKIDIKRNLSKMKFKVVKHSPEILMGLGVIGVIGAGVLACKSTLKLNGIVNDSKNTITKIHELVEIKPEEYTHEDAKKDLVIVYTTTALSICKLYTPSVILGTTSIICMVSSNNMLRKRNAALAAAFTTVTESFSRYRKSVVEKYGERADYELRHGIVTEKKTVTEVDEEGNEISKEVTVDVASEINGYSDYARFYDDGCTGWSKTPEYNLMFLKAQQQYANDKLVANGYLFLNDVYDMLGIPKSKAGQVVGWVYDPENPIGDNYVDFGLYDVDKTNVRDFVNGYEQTILLDFNVDGNIWDKM